MRRPLQFPKMSTNAGLTIGQGFANGLNSALDSYSKQKLQAAHMKALQTQAEGMKSWHEAQADALRQKTLGSSIQDVQLLNELSKGEYADKSVINKLVQPRIETFLAHANPDEKAGLMAHIKAQQDAGVIPSEISGDMNFNVNQMKYLSQSQNQQAKQNVAETSADARKYSSDSYGHTRLGVGQLAKEAVLGAAQIRTSANAGLSKQDQISLRGSQQRETELIKRWADADKPNTMGVAPDPAEVEKKRAMLKDMMKDEHEHQSKLLSPQGETPATQNTAAPQSKTWPHADWQKAQPGDMVQHNNGTLVKALGGGQFQPVTPAAAPSDPTAPAPTQSTPVPGAE